MRTTTELNRGRTAAAPDLASPAANRAAEGPARARSLGPTPGGRSTALPSTEAGPRQLRTKLAKRLNKLLFACGEDTDSREHLANRPDLAQALVEDAIGARASDIHLEPGPSEVRVRLRIDGAVSDVAALTLEQGRWLTNQFSALANLDPVVRFTPTDSHARLTVDHSTVDLRLALAPCQQGEALSIRLLDSKRLERSIDDLGLTEASLKQLEDWLNNVNGMFLAVGPTGCGKTTTLYALLHEIKFADRIAVSIEDPVEYEVPGITQVQVDAQHRLSFADGVKAMLRLDPDFLMIGEIRDAASAHAAVDAAITGRVLLSTVHSRDAVGAITALRNWGLPDHEIAESLAVVVAQRLARRLCPDCRKITPVTENETRWLTSLGLPIPKVAWTASGCSKCNGLGYFGRTGIFEFWRLRESDYRLILDHADEHTLRQNFTESHHGNLLTDGLAKVSAGVTSLAEIRRVSSGAFPADSLDAIEVKS